MHIETKRLERHIDSELLVPNGIYLTHPALTQEAFDSVAVGQTIARRKRVGARTARPGGKPAAEKRNTRGCYWAQIHCP